jgi:hypothetical protein
MTRPHSETVGIAAESQASVASLQLGDAGSQGGRPTVQPKTGLLSMVQALLSSHDRRTFKQPVGGLHESVVQALPSSHAACAGV